MSEYAKVLPEDTDKDDFILQVKARDGDKTNQNNVISFAITASNSAIRSPYYPFLEERAMLGVIDDGWGQNQPEQRH